MSIEELTELVPPPASPNEVGGDGERKQVESSLGIELPNDYWDYAALYGTGRFVTDNFEFTIANPFSSSFETSVEWGCESIESLKNSALGERVPYVAFPQSPGLFPWGNDINGNTLFWSTAGEPAEWPIVLCPETGEPDSFEVFEMPITSFLVQAIRRQIICKAWESALAFADGVPPRFAGC